MMKPEGEPVLVSECQGTKFELHGSDTQGYAWYWPDGSRVLRIRASKTVREAARVASFLLPSLFPPIDSPVPDMEVIERVRRAAYCEDNSRD